MPKRQVTIAALTNYQQQAAGQEPLIDALISDVSQHQP